MKYDPEHYDHFYGSESPVALSPTRGDVLIGSENRNGDADTFRAQDIYVEDVTDDDVGLYYYVGPFPSTLFRMPRSQWIETCGWRPQARPEVVKELKDLKVGDEVGVRFRWGGVAIRTVVSVDPDLILPRPAADYPIPLYAFEADDGRPFDATGASEFPEVTYHPVTALLRRQASNRSHAGLLRGKIMKAVHTGSGGTLAYPLGDYDPKNAEAAVDYVLKTLFGVSEETEET